MVKKVSITTQVRVSLSEIDLILLLRNSLSPDVLPELIKVKPENLQVVHVEGNPYNFIWNELKVDEDDQVGRPDIDDEDHAEVKKKEVQKVITGAEVVRRAQEEGINVVEFLKLHRMKTVTGWDGKCLMCGGDGPFRKPKNLKYSYDEECAWCRAETPIPIAEREKHPKAEDGGPI